MLIRYQARNTLDALITRIRVQKNLMVMLPSMIRNMFLKYESLYILLAPMSNRISVRFALAKVQRMLTAVKAVRMPRMCQA